MRSEIAERAGFDRVRYAQLWEDADVLTGALRGAAGATYVSIGSAGDNALALLTLDPELVAVYDLSPAQLACLRLRVSAMRALDHAEYLQLLGARPSDRRDALLAKAAAALDEDDRAFWRARAQAVRRHGLGGIGKFERYFRLFRRYVLPLVHGRRMVAELTRSKPFDERARFLEERWNSWRWRLMLRLFFNRGVMGRLGRDPAFFDHAEGDLPDHVARRFRHAAVDLDPAENPYLSWILTGRCGEAPPLAWRAETYETIRGRLDRLKLRLGPVERAAEDGVRADGFNLSDVFEYMSPAGFEAAYAEILRAAKPGARLVYWNMMAPRRAPAALAARVIRRVDLEAAGKAIDKAFFYSDFVVEEVAGAEPSAAPASIASEAAP